MTNNVDNYFEHPTDSSDNKLVLGGSVETSGGADLKTDTIALKIVDVSTAGQTYFYAPFAGELTKVTSVLNGTIATAPAVLTVKTVTGTAGTISITETGSNTGDIDSLIVASNGAVTAGSLIEVETSGASTNTIAADLTIEFTRT